MTAVQHRCPKCKAFTVLIDAGIVYVGRRKSTGTRCGISVRWSQCNRCSWTDKAVIVGGLAAKAQSVWGNDPDIALDMAYDLNQQKRR